MSNWQIEHVATADKRTLAAWGFASCKRTLINWGIDQLTLTVRSGTAGTAAPAWAYRDKIILWDGATRVLHGWVTTVGNTAEAAGESQPYVISGPGWWLANIAFEDSVMGGGQYLVGANDIQAIVQWCITCAISYGAPIALGTVAIAGIAPAVPTGQTCLSAMQGAARFSPMSVGWWDSSGTVPIFNAVGRAGATPLTVALGANAEAWAITPRHDLQIHRVICTYIYPNPTAGWDDIEDTREAGDSGYPLGPGCLQISIGVTDAAAASDAHWANVAGPMYDALSPLCWEGSVELRDCAAALPVVRPGMALNLTGGLAAWATMAAIIQQVDYITSAERNDSATVTSGPPEHLGPQDYLELYRLSHGASDGAGGNPPPYDPPTPPGGSGPGTLAGLGGLNNYEPSGGIDFESAGGLVTLIGFPENGGLESTPPKKYRTCSLSGSASWTGGWYGSGSEPHTETGSGASVCADDGTPNVGGNVHTYAHEYTDGGGGKSYTDRTADVPCTRLPSGIDIGSAYGFPVFVVSATSAYGRYCPPWGVNGTRFPVSADAGLNSVSNFGLHQENYTFTGRIYEQLDNEDTDETAFARFLATSGGAWATATSQVALWEPRTTGFDFEYHKLRFRPTKPTGRDTYGLEHGKPWWPYTITVNLERREITDSGVEVGAWEVTAPVVAQSTAEMDGFVPFPNWTEITPVKGYKIRVSPTLGIQYSGT